jgi:membrane protein implicated in regulation of membrane protease activity
VRSDPFDSSGRLIGREATVLTAEASGGHAVIAGALWAIASRSPLRPGDHVTVTAQQGELLLVTPRTSRRGASE